MALRRVFLVEELREGKDASAAGKHGELITLFDGQHRRPPVFRPTSFCEAVIDRLADEGFDPDLDGVVLAGGLIPNSLLLAALAAKCGRVTILMFDASASSYVAKEMDLRSTVGPQ